jgi:hypothetical protein
MHLVARSADAHWLLRSNVQTIFVPQALLNDLAGQIVDIAALIKASWGVVWVYKKPRLRHLERTRSSLLLIRLILLQLASMINASAFAIPPQQCTLETCTLAEAEVSYIPSLAGNAFFLAAFLVLLLVHTGLGVRYRTWGVLIGMFCGLVLEVIGYVGRVQMHYNPFKFDPFTM